MRKILRLCKYSTFPGKQLFYYKYIRQFNQVFYQRRKKIDLDLCVRTGGGKPSENRGADSLKTYSAHRYDWHRLRTEVLSKRCSAIFYVHPTGSPHSQIQILRTHVPQDFFQRIFAACMASDYVCIAPFRLFHRTADHFMGYGVCKEYDQIRASDLFAETCRHLSKNFCFAVEPLAYLFILTYHSVMAAYDNNTHIKPPDDNEKCLCLSWLVLANL